MGAVRFDYIARECRDTFKGSFENVPIVGLEHIEPYDMLLKKYEANVETTFTKSFKKGQILFGRRRAYQHKACVATFDGVCSGDITVIEPIEGRVDRKLLPFIIQNDDFFEHAIKGSNGALSPRVKWQHMASYMVNLPEPDRQKELADKLWAAYDVKQSYIKMIDAIDELVKSRFIEMFGNADITKPLSECIGTTFPGEWGEDDTDGSGVNVIRTTNFTNSGKLDLTDVVTRKIDQAKIDKKLLIPGDIILERSGGTSDNPVGRVVYFEAIGTFLFNNFTQLLRCKEGVNSLFVFYSLYNYYHTHKNEIRRMGNKTTGIQNLKMDKYWDIPIADASPEQEEQFVSLYKQANKSKDELRKSIEAIEKVIKSLINENL